MQEFAQVVGKSLPTLFVDYGAPGMVWDFGEVLCGVTEAFQALW